MHVIITGMNGTVAPAIANFYQQENDFVIPYDRTKISTENELEIEKFLLEEKTDILIHCAMGSPIWTKILAKICFKHHIKFVYISTVSVFSNENKGPHTIDKLPDATDDYGKYKIESESIALKENPKTYIIRLGWQIGYGRHSNQMIEFLYHKMETEGVIKASSLWYPSTSFLNDTAKAVYDIVKTFQPGIFHVNSNDIYTFYDIVKQLSKTYKDFIVVETKDFSADHRMVDQRVDIEKLSKIFK